MEKRQKGICSVCEKEKYVYQSRKSGKDVCPRCHRNGKKRICSTCKKLKVVQAYDEFSQPICYTCWYYDPSRCKVCSRCQKLKPVATHLKSKPCCKSCISFIRYHNPLTYEICSTCGKGPKPVKKRTHFGKAICHGCDKKTRRMKQSGSARSARL